MNDQWSGNTLLSAVRAKRAAPSRSSNQRASRGDQHQRVAVPEAGPDGLGVVALGAEHAVVVDHERELGQRAGRRAEHRLGAVEHRRTSTGGTGTAAAGCPAGRGRPGSPRACTPSSTRRSPRVPRSRDPGSWSPPSFVTADEQRLRVRDARRALGEHGDDAADVERRRRLTGSPCSSTTSEPRAPLRDGTASCPGSGRATGSGTAPRARARRRRRRASSGGSAAARVQPALAALEVGWRSAAWSSSARRERLAFLGVRALREQVLARPCTNP